MLVSIRLPMTAGAAGMLGLERSSQGYGTMKLAPDSCVVEELTREIADYAAQKMPDSTMRVLEPKEYLAILIKVLKGRFINSGDAVSLIMKASKGVANPTSIRNYYDGAINPTIAHGWYWMKDDKGWFVMEFDGSSWYCCGSEYTRATSYIDAIGSKIEPPQDWHTDDG